jgi:maleate cis-trans isomerase
MYGGRARIGCIVPSTNTVVVSGFNRMKPQTYSNISRTIFSNPFRPPRQHSFPAMTFEREHTAEA